MKPLCREIGMSRLNGLQQLRHSGGDVGPRHGRLGAGVAPHEHHCLPREIPGAQLQPDRHTLWQQVTLARQAYSLGAGVVPHQHDILPSQIAWTQLHANRRTLKRRENDVAWRQRLRSMRPP